MEDDVLVSINPVQQRALQTYLDWLRDVQPKGVTRKAILKYYEDDYENHAYKVDVAGNTHAYTVFTKPGWLGLTGGLDEFVSSTKSTGRVDHKPEKVKRLAREMYVRNFGVTNEEVNFRLKKLLWNGDSICISSLDSEPAQFEIEHTDFFSYVSNGEAMLREFYDALWENEITDPEAEDEMEQAFDQLEMRDTNARRFTDFTVWHNHFHKVGPVCLLVMKRPDGKHDVYFTQRSHAVLQAPDFYSVTPAGELQEASRVSEASFEDKAIEELCEEVLGTPDEVDAGVDPGHLSQDVNASRIRKEVEEGNIHMRRTAFGFDMYAVKPMFTGLMYVSDPETAHWIRSELDTNWESEKLKRVTLPRSGIPKEMHPNTVCSSGALAFFEGMRALENQFGVDTGLDFTLHQSMR